MLETAETRWGPNAILAARKQHQPPTDAYLWPLLYGSPRPAAEIVMPKGVAKGPVVEVRVNHGVWQTPCPFCMAAQHAASGERLFYCGECCNEQAGHRALPVRWPDNPDAVERQLAVRPLARHRNWEPGETIKDLRRQDKEWAAARG